MEKILFLAEWEKKNKNKKYLEKGYAHDFLPKEILGIIKAIPKIYTNITYFCANWGNAFICLVAILKASWGIWHLRQRRSDGDEMILIKMRSAKGSSSNHRSIRWISDGYEFSHFYYIIFKPNIKSDDDIKDSGLSFGVQPTSVGWIPFKYKK